MNTPFAQRLLELLPAVYRDQDVHGDLAAFLGVVGPTLDEVKALMDNVPASWDVDNCDAPYLPLLGAIVGVEFDPRRDADAQRRVIREAIEQYRRKGTLPSMRRAMERIGWQGRIDETFHKAFRLNRRAIVNQQKLPGEVFSLGVYRVDSDTLTDGLREVLAPHHPAGIRRFFLQRLFGFEDQSGHESAVVGVNAHMFTTSRSNKVFALGRTRLNTNVHLTTRNTMTIRRSMVVGHMARQDFSSSAVFLSRWHAPRTGFKVNRNALNSVRIQNVDTSELRYAAWHWIEAGSIINNPGQPLRLGRGSLNHTRMGHSAPTCHVTFQQVDNRVSANGGPLAAHNLYLVTSWPEE